MKLFLPLIIIFCAFAAAGCEDNGPATADNVTEQIQNMEPEARFDMIKKNTGMSPQMKERSIDGLPVDDAQKQAWKDELKNAPAPDQTAR